MLVIINILSLFYFIRISNYVSQMLNYYWSKTFDLIKNRDSLSKKFSRNSFVQNLSLWLTSRVLMHVQKPIHPNRKSSASRPTSVLHLSLSRSHALAIKFALPFQSASNITVNRKKKQKKSKFKKCQHAGKKKENTQIESIYERTLDILHCFPEIKGRT